MITKKSKILHGQISINDTNVSNKKIVDLKIELLKNPTKRGRIKKEIARLLTMAHNSVLSKKGTEVPVSSGKNLTKSEGKV